MQRAGWDVVVLAQCIDQVQLANLSRDRGVTLAVRQGGEWRQRSFGSILAMCLVGAAQLLRTCPASIFKSAAWAAVLQGLHLRDSGALSDADVVHAHFGPVGLYVSIASNVPTIINFHGYDATSWPARWGWGLYRCFLDGRLLVAHSAFVERQLTGAELRQVCRVTMGVDLAAFSSPRRANIWGSRVRLLSVGRLGPQKGHAEAIKMVDLLRRRLPDIEWSLTIVGEGPSRDQLVNLVAELKLDEVVNGFSPVSYSDLPSIYAAADILVVASQTQPDGWREAFCRVAVEGMACGMAVVATPCGGLVDTIGAGGLMAKGESPEDLADAVVQVLTSRTPNEFAGKAVKQAGQFTIQQMCADYEKVTAI
ncbi:MAG TPA: glycosyltransferase family 4 protein, partial [Gammaproteobacteria bacterium]